MKPAKFFARLRSVIFRTVKTVLLALPVFCALLAGIDWWIGHRAQPYIYSDPALIPSNNAGLLLGTTPLLKGRKKNPYFENRIAAAVALYNCGKIKHIIVSGDNRTPQYNEPEEMRRQLVRLGIPNAKIYLDASGLRTLDSVVRCREIFGQQGFTVISQEFHNQRAVFLGRAKGYDIIAFNAEDVDFREGVRTRLREYFARLDALLDLFIYKEEHFLDSRVEIKDATAVSENKKSG